MEEMRVSVSIARKINLGDYESADVFMAISNIEPGASDAEIEEALATGDQAIQILKKHVGSQIVKIRAQGREMG